MILPGYGDQAHAVLGTRRDRNDGQVSRKVAANGVGVTTLAIDQRRVRRVDSSGLKAREMVPVLCRMFEYMKDRNYTEPTAKVMTVVSSSTSYKSACGSEGSVVVSGRVFLWDSSCETDRRPRRRHVYHHSTEGGSDCGTLEKTVQLSAHSILGLYLQ